MYIVPESVIDGLLTRADSFQAVEAVFASMARGAARNFPVIREAIGHAQRGVGGDLAVVGVVSLAFWALMEVVPSAWASRINPASKASPPLPVTSKACCADLRLCSR